MATAASPTPLPLHHSTRSFVRRSSSLQLHRTGVFGSTTRTDSGSRSVGYLGSSNGKGSLLISRPRTYSASDTSDDDVPEPIKFSASVKALLGEDASGLDTPAAGNGINGSGAAGDNSKRGSPKSGCQRERRVRIASPAEPTGCSPPAPRVVRIPSGPRSSPISNKDTSVLEKSGHREEFGLGGSPNELITPAVSRSRSVRISGTRSHTPTGERGLTEDRINDRSFSTSNSEIRPFERNGVRSHTTSGPRRRSGEDGSVQSSVRVKRVGKLSGTFLNGPARRGVLRRQGEENHLPAQDSRLVTKKSPQSRLDSPQRVPPSPSLDLLSFPGRYQSPEPPSGNDRDRHALTPPRGPAPGNPEHGEVHFHKRSRTGSLGPYNLRPFAGTGSAPAELPKRTGNVDLHNQAPPLRPFTGTLDQENDAPPTFQISNVQGVGILDKIERLSIACDNNKLANEPPVRSQSPRRPPLGPRSSNTPHRPAPPPPPPKMNALEAATATAGATVSSQSHKKRAQVTVNKNKFTRLDCIGRGGSSRVFRVMAENCAMLALKRVNLDGIDSLALAGYKGEIDLLKRLENVDRVVRLYDWEINEQKHTLSVLMELAELDLSKIITQQLSSEDGGFDPAFTRFYWKEMLECVQAVHDFDIVHSDLKPANFILVKGKLKIIDFGISNTIQDDTVNVHREQQVGTPNYMAPEALIDCNAASGLPASMGKMMKVGKPSDVWSLGCILYQMVYGKAPFAHLAKHFERILAITNPKFVIEFPPFGVGGVPIPPGLIRTLKQCLQRDQKLRPAIKQLLSEGDQFLYPDSQYEGKVPITQEMLRRILTNVVNHCRTRGLPTDEELAGWPAGFFTKIRAAVEEDAG